MPENEHATKSDIRDIADQLNNLRRDMYEFRESLDTKYADKPMVAELHRKYYDVKDKIGNVETAQAVLKGQINLGLALITLVSPLLTAGILFLAQRFFH